MDTLARGMRAGGDGGGEDDDDGEDGVAGGAVSVSDDGEAGERAHI